VDLNFSRRVFNPAVRITDLEKEPRPFNSGDIILI